MRYLYSIFSTLLIFLSLLILPFRVNSLIHDWVEVPQSKYGSQVWDQSNTQKNLDGSIRILSKFIPKTKNAITKDILYTMDINCSGKTFRDVAMGSKDFDEFKNTNTDWKSPNGDKLILGIIEQVCNFSE
tara:strand:- start:25 stop:414 length:390 start_codon:yes stop_codon:yes gene_type:complete